MKKISVSLATVLFLFMVMISCQKEFRQSPDQPVETNGVAAKKKSGQPITTSVFATGLNNPRGLKFGPDGMLYVAEAGVGGTESTAGTCPQVPAPEGPFTGSANGGRVSRIDMAGNRTTVSNQLPSSLSGRGDIEGPADVAFVKDQLYVLISGAGCPQGVPSMNNGIVRINPDGSPTMIADLATWRLAHPPANPSQDFNPLGVWYSLVERANKLYALDANQGGFVEVSLTGQIQLVNDMSATLGHIVPTALTERGNFYMGNLDVFPITGKSSVYKITPSGKIKEIASGFSAILGLVVDQQSRIYVLEMTSGSLFPQPGAGRIVRVEPNGKKEVIVSGLSLPTGMAQGPDGNLYVSNWGFGKPPGGGEIVKVTLE